MSSRKVSEFERMGSRFRFVSLAVPILYHGLLVLRKNTNFSALYGVVKTKANRAFTELPYG